MTVKLMSEQVKNEFVDKMIQFAEDHKLTAHNVLQATSEVIDHMANNAVLEDGDSQETPINPPKAETPGEGSLQAASTNFLKNKIDAELNATVRVKPGMLVD
ncbi:MAG: hypothetical protein NC293_12530 [Roseburia sp.]|nr:hypothetical protein [Roseburia sp.]